MDTINTARLSEIKDALCRYYNLSMQHSSLTLRQRNILTLRGHNNHIVFVIEEGERRYRAFGKVSTNTEREYRNLHYVVSIIPEAEMRLPRPIALLKTSNGLLLLQEYLEGYSHLFSANRLKYILPGRTAAFESMGKEVIDTIYRVEQRFPVTNLPLSADDAKGIPNQPKPVGVFYQLETIRSLPLETKKVIKSRINWILGSNTLVRRGVVHGDMGLRNVMICSDDISFIDWDFMQLDGFSLIDPCYFVTMLMMRSVQLCLPWSKVTSLGKALVQHVKLLEESIADSNTSRFIDRGIWYGMCLSMIDTLWWYEKQNSDLGKAILKQRGRQLNFLAKYIEREAVNEHN